MRRNKWLIGLVFILTGCAGSSVDYVDESGERTTTAAESNTETESTTHDADKSVWKETVTGIGSDGKEYKFPINAKIETLYDEMSIYEYELIRELSPADKQRITGAIFDDEVYLYDEKYVPKAVWDDTIAFYEQLVEEMEHGELQDYYATELDNYRKLKEDAPDSLIIADDFSGYRYLGNIDGLPYVISFRLEDTINVPEYRNYASVDLYKGNDGFTSGILYTPFINLWPESHSVYEERWLEAKQLTGFRDVQDIVTRLLWNVMESDVELVEDTQSMFPDNKIYIINQGPECFSGNILYSYKYEIEEDGEKTEVTVYSGGYSGEAWLSQEEGILNKGINWSIGSPSVHIDTKLDVSLISVENVKEIMKNELSNNPEFYSDGDGPDNQYSSLELGYIAVANKEANRYSKVPCWRLASDSFIPVLYVNAIDGTIIKPDLKVFGEGYIRCENGYLGGGVF